jgi:serine/threonine protein kinase
MLEKISTGEMTQLYRVRTTGGQGQDSYIAIKMIHPQLASDKKWVKAFIDETKLAALMKHPNIVEIYDFGLLENSFFVAMEYLCGKDLGSIVRRSQEKNMPLGPGLGLHIASQICSGLGYAHNLRDLQGNPLLINHRAIRPENILITYQGEIKIINFGIARATSQTLDYPGETVEQDSDYLSPEQIAGKETDHRSDIFSTGMLLFEIVTHKRPDAEPPAKALERIQQAEFEALDAQAIGLSAKIYKILQKALAQEMSLRYPSCEEMRLEIEEAISLLSERPTPQELGNYTKSLFPEDMETQRFISGETADAEPEADSELNGQIKVVEDILKKAKTTVEEEPPKGKRRLIYYAVFAAILIAFATFLSFKFDKEFLNPSGREALTPPFPKTTANPSPLKAVLSDENRNRQEISDRYAEAQALLAKAVGIIEKNPKEAEALLLKTIKIDPGNAKAYFQLGLAYTALKNSTQAIKAYQKVVQLHSDFPDAYFNLGYLYATKKDYATAEKMFGQAVKKNPPYLDEALFNLGLVQAKQGKREESIKSLERALQINPQNQRAQKFLEKLKEDS